MVHLCKDLGIRHPEELSFCKQLEQQHLKKNYSSFPKAKFQANEYEYGRDYISPAADTNSFIPTHSTLLTSSNGSLDSPNGPFSCAPYQHNTYQKPRHTNPIGSPTGVSKFHNTYAPCICRYNVLFFKNKHNIYYLVFNLSYLFTIKMNNVNSTKRFYLNFPISMVSFFLFVCSLLFQYLDLEA